MKSSQLDKEPAGFVPRHDPLLLGAALLLIVVALGSSVGAVAWVGEAFPGFLVLENRLVAAAGLERWPATSGGEIYRHEIVAVNGQPLEHIEDLAAQVRSLPVGSEIRYRLRKNGREVQRIVPSRRFESLDFVLLFGTYLLNGLALGAAALGIRAYRGRHCLANATVPALLLGSLWSFSALDLYGPHALFRLHALCELLLIPALLHLALCFPHPARVTQRWRGVVSGPYLCAGAVAVIQQLGLTDPSQYARLQPLIHTGFAAALLLLIISQLYRFLRPPSFEAHQRIKAFALGTAIALTPPAALTLRSLLSGASASENLVGFATILFPLSLGYATLRHNLLSVDALLRRTLSYGLLAAIVAGVYVVAIAGIESVFDGTASSDGTWFPLCIAALCVAGIAPQRDRLQLALDRLFSRPSWDFRRTVETLSRRLASVTNLEIIAEDLFTSVSEALHPDSLSLFVRHERGEPLEPMALTSPSPKDVAAALIQAEHADVPFDLEAGGLGVPFRKGPNLAALLVLGRRRSGALYGAEDRRLLQTLAHQGALAFQNSLAVEHVRELNRSLEDKVNERTRELGATLDELREKNEMLAHLSTTDAVTGLFSRRAVMERLTEEVHRCRRHQTGLAVLMMDLDYFKEVNDSYGHLAGDEVLKSVGEVVSQTLRRTDVAGRFGGEEFLVALVESDPEQARVFAERLRGGIENLCFETDDGRRFQVTISIGVAGFEPAHRVGEDLIAAADAALYCAKEAGRNRVEVSRPKTS